MLWDDQYFYFVSELIEEEISAILTERNTVIFHDMDFDIFIDPDDYCINTMYTVWDLLVKPTRKSIIFKKNTFQSMNHLQQTRRGAS